MPTRAPRSLLVMPNYAAFVAAATLLVACKGTNGGAHAAQPGADSVHVAQAGSDSGAAAAAPNTLTAAERAAGWKLLFDGNSFAGWHALGYGPVPPSVWTIKDGEIEKLASGKVAVQADGQPIKGADLITDSTYKNFELTFQWKVTPGANSGVKYNVSEELSKKFSGNNAALGFEYQVLDDSLHPDGKLPTHRASALYDLIAPNASKHLNPVGQWNTSRIVFDGNHGEHWLNGAKVVEYDLGTPAFDSLLKKSKYRTIPGFADRRSGHVVLQDHPGRYQNADEVWYRNVKIRVLPDSASR